MRGHGYTKIILLLEQLTQEVQAMAATLDDILVKVAAEKTADDSIIALLVEVKTKLNAAIATGDLAKIQAVADALDSEQAKIIAAVKANTPAQ